MHAKLNVDKVPMFNRLGFWPRNPEQFAEAKLVKFKNYNSVIKFLDQECWLPIASQI